MAIFGVLKRFPGEAKIINFSRDRFFCSVLEEHDESSRMPVSTWVCALSFGRCRMSKFWLLVYLDFFESLRPALGCAYTPTSPRALTRPTWCGVLRTRRHGPPPLSFPVGHELPVPGSPTGAPRRFPSAARPRFLARLGAVARCRAGCSSARSAAAETPSSR